MSQFDQYLSEVFEKGYAYIADYYMAKAGTGDYLAFVLRNCPPGDYTAKKTALEQGMERLSAYFEPKPTPEHYVCSSCKANGVKLWRQYNTMADHLDLLCGPCACKDQKKDAAKLGDDGRLEGDYGKSDQIGWLVPAVPCDDTYWGYTSVPQPGVLWWYQLPVRK